MALNPRQWWSQKRRELELQQGELASKQGGGGRCPPCFPSSKSSSTTKKSGGTEGSSSRRDSGDGRCWFMIPSVKEVAEATLHTLTHHETHGQTAEEEERLALARGCTDAGVKAGVRAGSYACVGSAIPTLIAVRTIPWAKHNVNYTGQALIISACTIAAYFITTEQTILACSRDASYARLQKKREAEGSL